MARRTIEISRNPAHLAISRGQLLITPKDPDSSERGARRYGRHDDGQPDQSRRPASPDRTTLASMRRRIPAEDIGLLVVDHVQTTYTHSVLATLAAAGAAIVICGDDHLPVAILLPMSSHTEQVWRVADQIDCSRVLRKQLWQWLVRAKIMAQSRNLPGDAPQRVTLNAMARRVRSGDVGNLEAQAARVYWQALFPPVDGWRFKRLPGGGRDAMVPNNLLDYGYAILRAAIARALIGAGLMPVIGIQHSNRSNAFCLADDLVEPLRPMIDRRVRTLWENGQTVLDQPTKARLLLVLTATVQIGEGESATVGPLDAALTRYAASLAQSYASGQVELLIPVEPDLSTPDPPSPVPSPQSPKPSAHA
jgi:CRISP-associated protein Cas1